MPARPASLSASTRYGSSLPAEPKTVTPNWKEAPAGYSTSGSRGGSTTSGRGGSAPRSHSGSTVATSAEIGQTGTSSHGWQLARSSRAHERLRSAADSAALVLVQEDGIGHPRADAQRYGGEGKGGQGRCNP